MWLLALFFAVVAALGATMATKQADDERSLTSARSRAIAESMAVYRTTVVDWARQHPHFEGPLPAPADMPAWWRGHPAIQAAAQGRFVAVYVTGPEAGSVLAEMLRLANGSVWVGLANRGTGTLHSPTLGDTGMAVPDVVPDKAPVWLALRS